MAYFGPTNYTSPGPDNLFAGLQVNAPITDEVILKADAVNVPLVRGTVLGRITASGLCVPVSKAATDGSENVYAILSETRDVSAGNQPAPAYLTGEFSETALVFAIATNTAADHELSARENGIFFKSVVPA